MTIEIIPAIDIIEGKCVRLAQGDFSRKTEYAGDPAEIVLRYSDAGIRRLHMVDLDGAKNGKPQNLSTLESVAAKSDLIIDYGGGVRTEQNVKEILSAGAVIVNVGSIAVQQPDLLIGWATKYGEDRFLLGVDSRNGNAAINGWQTRTDIPIIDVLRKFSEAGIKNAFVTDVGRDGMMAGPAVNQYKTIKKELPDLNLIASGGVRNMEDVERVAEIGCTGVIIGKAIYEGRITLKEISEYVGKTNSSLS